jgi:hypothetical protein
MRRRNFEQLFFSPRKNTFRGTIFIRNGRLTYHGHALPLQVAFESVDGFS